MCYYDRFRSDPSVFCNKVKTCIMLLHMKILGILRMVCFTTGTGQCGRYGYDNPNRLISEKCSGIVGLDDSYTYDPGLF